MRVDPKQHTPHQTPSAKWAATTGHKAIPPMPWRNHSSMSIATTAKSIVFSPQFRWPILPYAVLLTLLGIMATFFSRQTRKFKLRFSAGMAVVALLVLAGCGVSMKTPGPAHNPGTPAGTSAVTVTASSASGGATATSVVNLTVQ